MYSIIEQIKYKINFNGFEKGETTQRKINGKIFETKRTAKKQIQQLKQRNKKTNACKLWALNYKIIRSN